MNLIKPLTTIDCETTGLDTQKDAIFSFAAIKEHPDGQIQTYATLVKPWKPIPREVELLTGTNNADVANAPLFADVAPIIRDFLSGSDLCGFNILGFDALILWEEFWRVGIDLDLAGVAIVDASVIYKRKEERTLTAAVKFYCGREHIGVHGAPADAQATRDVLQAQLVRYGDISELTTSALAQLCATDRDGGVRMDLAGTLVRDKDGVPRYTHKKVRGVAVEEDMGYAGWMLRSDFSEQTKRVIRAVLQEIETKGQRSLL